MSRLVSSRRLCARPCWKLSFNLPSHNVNLTDICSLKFYTLIASLLLVHCIISLILLYHQKNDWLNPFLNHIYCRKVFLLWNCFWIIFLLLISHSQIYFMSFPCQFYFSMLWSNPQSLINWSTEELWKHLSEM